LREVLILVAVERLSYEETATLLRVPVATVFARLVQAREALRSLEFEPMTAPKSAS
jgi:RNA polymerase sigma-70 factor (ECF subfamily)